MINEENSGKLPHYDKPPITEVAFSVLFLPLDGLLSPHIGLLWERFQPEYPYCTDSNPIVPEFEFFDQTATEPLLEQSDISPLPRVVFTSQDETRIIQIQRDGFACNWRKVDMQDNYPKYSNLIAEFQKNLVKFEQFLENCELEKLQPLQYELTYVNQIPQGEAWLTFEDIGKIFPDMSWRKNALRFLTNPQSIAWDTVFELPDQIGRLYTSLKSIKIEDESILLFEMTVRGMGNYRSRELLQDWFNIAHEWIVSAFTDLTNSEIQAKIWKRRS